ncbi:MAG: RNA polymerase sigma factor SigI [Carboxydocellales bacterium]
MPGLFKSLSSKREENYKELLRKAQQGEPEAREQLIRQYTPFILRVLSQKSGRYLRLGEDDEVSVGLMAFDEAITAFERERGANFLTFAETTIKRRLIDHYRRESRFSKVVPISALEQENGSIQDAVSQITARQAVAEFQAKGEAQDRKDEILAYSKILNEYGITFAELVAVSPKHDDARKRAMEAAYLVAENEELKRFLLVKKELPLKILTDLVDVSRKTLERQRKYIIAIVLVLIFEFTHLKEYIKDI